MIINQGLQLPSRKRTKPWDSVVLHETVTFSAAATLRVLQKRGLSVHFIVAPDGTVTQHVPIENKALHAGLMNTKSVGIEVVNPYYGKYAARASSTWKTVIKPKWAHTGSYLVPTLASLEATYALLHALYPAGLAPFQNVKGNSIYMGRLTIPKIQFADAGIYPHTAFAHADGAFISLYCFLRQTNADPQALYNELVTNPKYLNHRVAL